VAHAQMLLAAQDHEFTILAYCYMRDHVHLALRGISPDADLRTFARVAKQRSGYWLRHECGLDDVWQVGYFERVLRDDEPTETIVRYVLANPIRAGLVERPQDYPFSGAPCWPEWTSG
jgi:putative transposase